MGGRGRPLITLPEQLLSTSAALKLFVVERRLPAVTPEGLAMLQAALADASRRQTTRGEVVRYLRSTYLPEQDRVLCLFEAGSAEAVRVVNETAQAPYRSIVAAVERPAP
jgi:hypothetical protein